MTNYNCIIATAPRKSGDHLPGVEQGVGDVAVLAMQASSVGLLDQGGEIENEKAGAAGANGLN